MSATFTTPATVTSTMSLNIEDSMHTSHTVDFHITPDTFPTPVPLDPPSCRSLRSSACRRLEIAPPTHNQIIEMENAIQHVLDDKHPYMDSVVGSGSEPNSFPGASLAESSRPKYAPRAVVHLRSYLRGAQLPQLYRASTTSPYAHGLFPSGDQAKRNLLIISSNHKRKISQIRKYPREIFNKATKLYLLENIYGSEDFITLINTGVPASSPDEALTLDSYLGSRIIFPEEEVPIRYPSDLPGLIEWFDRYPLRTMTRAIHLANPSTTRWWFDRILPQELGEDFMANSKMLAVLGWRFHPDTSYRPWFKELDDEMGWVVSKKSGIDFLRVHPHQNPWFITSSGVSLAIIIQAPWILSWDDLKIIACCEDLPELTDPTLDPSKHYTMAQRVWCQIRDACQKLNTKYFILTTYEGWLFGKFGGGRGGSGYIPTSKNAIQDADLDSFTYHGQKMKIAPWAFDQWTYVETSELLGFNASNPTMMQFLYFWTARSMGLKKSREFALEIQLAGKEVTTANCSTTYVPEKPATKLPHYEFYEFQHHTGNRPRRPPRSSPRFAPYPKRPPQQASTETSSTGRLFTFIKSLSKYFSGATRAEETTGDKS